MEEARDESVVPPPTAPIRLPLSRIIWFWIVASLLMLAFAIALVLGWILGGGWPLTLLGLVGVASIMTSVARNLLARRDGV